MASPTQQRFLEQTRDIHEERLLDERPRVSGKFFFHGKDKLYIRGVTYGPFHPDKDGCLYHNPEIVHSDFSAMGVHGINAVRTYTVPPVWLLDAAGKNGLWVMVGIPWEQHVTFLDSSRTADAIEERVRDRVRACAGHPAVLGYTVGNEIPASIVRWHGRQRIERFIQRLYLAAKQEDPSALVTYVNFPSTEYLQLGFLDFISFNVYLEEQDRLETYLARLQTLAGDRPLVMAEVGLDSRRNGVNKQAEVLEWQVRTVFTNGCAGMFVFAWTDEWWRGGYEIEDWDFGMVDRQRNPKPALCTVSAAMKNIPFPRNKELPFISIVICSYNGSATIRDTLKGVTTLEYPNFEVIVINDGSTDQTPSIVTEYPVKLISTPNRGLS